MNTAPMTYQKDDAPPAMLWSALIVLCAAAWSFRLVSFLHAKDLVLAVGLPAVMLGLYWKRPVAMHGFRVLAPLWAGLALWTLAGGWKAAVPAYHLEALTRWVLVLLAASLALNAFQLRNGRLWLYGGFILSGMLVGALALLQYAGLVDFLFPVFPGYDQRAYSVFGNQNLLGGYTAFTLVLSFSLYSRLGCRARLGASLFYALTATILMGALVISGSRSAWLAALAGCVFIVLGPGGRARLCRLLRRWRRGFVLLPLALVLIMLAVSAPMLTTRTAETFSETDVGGHARLWFWAGAVRMFRDHPITGAGLGQYAYWSPFYQGEVLWQPGGERFFHNELHTVHAHSEPLEWLAETGVSGLFPWLIFLWLVIRRRNPAMPALAALAVFACFNTISHSTPHLLAVLLLAGHNGPQAISGTRLPRFAAVLLVLLASAAYFHTTLIPSLLVCRAEQTHVVDGPALPLYERALEWPWPSPGARESYAIALMDRDAFAEARYQLQLARTGLDTGRVHLLLSVCAVALGDDRTVVHHARECLFRWPDNEYAWSVLLERIPEDELPVWHSMRERFQGGSE